MSEKSILDENYYIVHGWMINRLNLKGMLLTVYAIIYGFSKEDDKEFTGSLNYLSRFCGGVSKPTVIKALKELTHRGLIIRREKIIDSITFVSYRVNLQMVKNFIEE